MTPLYLGITAFLALVDAAASFRAWTTGAPGADGLGLLQVLWMFVSGAFILVFRARGVWPGAPIAHASAVLLGVILAANGEDASAYWWPLRILMAVAVLALSAATL